MTKLYALRKPTEKQINSIKNVVGNNMNDYHFKLNANHLKIPKMLSFISNRKIDKFNKVNVGEFMLKPFNPQCDYVFLSYIDFEIELKKHSNDIN